MHLIERLIKTTLDILMRQSKYIPIQKVRGEPIGGLGCSNISSPPKNMFKHAATKGGKKLVI